MCDYPIINIDLNVICFKTNKTINEYNFVCETKDNPICNILGIESKYTDKTSMNQLIIIRGHPVKDSYIFEFNISVYGGLSFELNDDNLKRKFFRTILFDCFREIGIDQHSALGLVYYPEQYKNCSAHDAERYKLLSIGSRPITSDDIYKGLVLFYQKLQNKVSELDTENEFSELCERLYDLSYASNGLLRRMNNVGLKNGGFQNMKKSIYVHDWECDTLANHHIRDIVLNFNLVEKQLLKLGVDIDVIKRT